MQRISFDRNDPTWGQEWSYKYLKGRDGTVGDDRYAGPPIRNSTDFAASLAAVIRGAQMIMDGEDYRTKGLSDPTAFEYHVYSTSNRPVDIFCTTKRIDKPDAICHYTAVRGCSPAPRLIDASFIAPDGRRMNEQDWLVETDPVRPKPIPFENPPAPKPDYVLTLFGWRITFTRTFPYGDNHVYRSRS